MFDLMMYSKEYYNNLSLLQAPELVTPELQSIRQEGDYTYFSFCNKRARDVYIGKAKRFVTFIAPVEYVYDSEGGRLTNVYKTETFWEKLKTKARRLWERLR